MREQSDREWQLGHGRNECERVQCGYGDDDVANDALGSGGELFCQFSDVEEAGGIAECCEENDEEDSEVAEEVEIREGYHGWRGCGRRYSCYQLNCIDGSTCRWSSGGGCIERQHKL